MARTYRGAERVDLMTRPAEAHRREMRRKLQLQAEQITANCADELDAIIAAALRRED